jgi:putative transposase
VRHLKEGRRVLCQGVRLKYAFINKHSTDYPVRRLCQTLKVHPSGYYAWLAEPQSARAKEDNRLLGLIKHAWLESGGVYPTGTALMLSLHDETPWRFRLEITCSLRY